MADIQLFLEAERRGILPADKLGLLQEARNRGLIPPLDQPVNVTPTARQTGTIVDQIPGSNVQAPAATAPVQTKPFTFGQKIMGAIETVPALVTGAVTAPIVEGAKIYGALTSGKFGTQAGIKAGEETGRKVQEQFYQPRTQAGQQYVGDIGNALASTGLQGVPMNVLADFQRGVTPAVRAVTDATGAKVAQRTERLAQEASNKDYQRASQIDAGKTARELDLFVNPAEANPTLGTNLAVGVAGKSNVGIKNAKVNKVKLVEIARDDLGLPKNTPLDDKAWNKALAMHDAPYQVIEKIPVMQASDDVLAQLNGLKLDPLSTSSPEKVARINASVDRALEQVVGGLSGKNVVSQSRDFRKDANRTFKNPNATGIEIDVAEAQIGIADALENLIDFNIKDPKALAEFRAARTGKAKVYDWERATSVTTKQVDPTQLVKMVEKGQPLTGKLAQVAEVAGNFPKDFDLSRNYLREAFQYLRRGGVGGTIGLAIGGPLGAAIGAGVTSLGSEAAARILARPGVQNRLAMPQDRRIPLSEEVNIPSSQNAMIPVAPEVFDAGGQPAARLRIIDYDVNGNPIYAPARGDRSPGTPDFTMQSEPTFGNRPTVFESQRGLPNEVPRQVYEAQKRAEMAQEFRAKDERKPAGRGTELMFDAAGNLVEAPTVGAGGVIGAPSALESAISKMAGQMAFETKSQYKTSQTGSAYPSRAPMYETQATDTLNLTPAEAKKYVLPTRQSQAFNMTAEEKIAFNKARGELAEIMPGMKTLDDKAVAGRLMDLEWIKQAVIKGNEKARMLDDIIARSDNERLRQDAMMKREILDGTLETLEEQFRKARPVKTGGQGPKTRAFQRNMLRPDGDEIQNALVK